MRKIFSAEYVAGRGQSHCHGDCRNPRDALHETINLHGISLNMIDTAGIHETQDVVEKIGVERPKNMPWKQT